ncbi:peroxidase [Artemisia annua]|uniref:Peroxidase n=1 Tax=Artemisia annua TaxID=35608 RepID=A0A2U1LBS4_ARTAN|nr:peroxidase [Artemisia annua]
MDSKKSILFVVLLATLITLALGQTRVGFYQTSCPRVETIVQTAVRSAINSNPAIAPGLLRMHFHDCFVNGCDASILIDGASSEKTAPPNGFLRGFEVIDAAKTQLETACPGVVSCADILALAARDSVVQTGGASWQVPLGRRDGLVSRASDTGSLPGFNEPLNALIRKFADKNLNTQDLVTLSGAHTIGTASCLTFSYRLYNYNNTNGPDPSIDPSFLPTLRNLCPNGGDGTRRVTLDTSSVGNFDNSYYRNLRNRRGVLESDAALWNNPATQTLVNRFLGIRGLAGLTFNVEFGRSMVKMGNIELKTGSQGEIRRVCTAIN